MSPKAVAYEPSSFHQSPKFGPGHFRINFISGARRAETAIRAGNDTLTADGVGKAHDALGDQLRMFDKVNAMRDNAWNEDLSLR